MFNQLTGPILPISFKQILLSCTIPAKKNHPQSSHSFISSCYHLRWCKALRWIMAESWTEVLHASLCRCLRCLHDWVYEGCASVAIETSTYRASSSCSWIFVEEQRWVRIKNWCDKWEALLVVGLPRRVYGFLVCLKPRWSFKFVDISLTEPSKFSYFCNCLLLQKC